MEYVAVLGGPRFAGFTVRPRHHVEVVTCRRFHCVVVVGLEGGELGVLVLRPALDPSLLPFRESKTELVRGVGVINKHELLLEGIARTNSASQASGRLADGKEGDVFHVQ